MQVRKNSLAALVVCLISTAALAQTSLRVTPTSVSPGEEVFITIFASGLSSTDVISVRYSGTGGEATVEPSYVDPEKIIVFVPSPIINTEGDYRVDVFVTRGAEFFQIGPGFFRVEVPDIELPPLSLILPEMVLGEATSLQGGVVNFEAVSSDGTPVNCTPPSGGTFPLGASTVNCSATNALGQTATGSFPALVLDFTPPTITVPKDISSTDSVVTWTVTAIDAVDPNPTTFCSPASGSTFPNGTTSVLCWAVDHHANFAFDTFNVTVNIAGAPVLTVPNDITAEATSPNGAVVSFTATATENATVTCTPASGSTFALGQTVVTCTATNNVGSDTESFSVFVVDTTPPTVISVSASPSTLWPPDHKMVPVTISIQATDAVDPAPVAVIVSVSSNQPENGTGDGDTAPDWVITGPLTVNLRSERAGTQDRKYKIVVQVSDSSGNIRSVTVEVVVTQSRRRSA